MDNFEEFAKPDLAESLAAINQRASKTIWWILDEVPQFRKLESLIKLNEIGRGCLKMKIKGE